MEEREGKRERRRKRKEIEKLSREKLESRVATIYYLNCTMN